MKNRKFQCTIYPNYSIFCLLFFRQAVEFVDGRKSLLREPSPAAAAGVQPAAAQALDKRDKTGVVRAVRGAGELGLLRLRRAAVPPQQPGVRGQRAAAADAGPVDAGAQQRPTRRALDEERRAGEPVLVLT